LLGERNPLRSTSLKQGEPTDCCVIASACAGVTPDRDRDRRVLHPFAVTAFDLRQHQDGELAQLRAELLVREDCAPSRVSRMKQVSVFAIIFKMLSCTAACASAARTTGTARKILLLAARCGTPVDHEHRSGDITGRVRSQEDAGISDLPDATEAAQGASAADLCPPIGIAPTARSRRLGFDWAGHDAVDPNAEPAPLGGV